MAPTFPAITILPCFPFFSSFVHHCTQSFVSSSLVHYCTHPSFFPPSFHPYPTFPFASPSVSTVFSSSVSLCPSSASTTLSSSVCTTNPTSVSHLGTPRRPQGAATESSSSGQSPLRLNNLQLNNVHALPSSLINKEQLQPVEDVVRKYVKLRGESNAGRLACKIAKEAIFRPDVTKMCTPIGSREKPGLPLKELRN